MILGLRSQSLAPPQALCRRPLRGLPPIDATRSWGSARKASLHPRSMVVKDSSPRSGRQTKRSKPQRLPSLGFEAYSIGVIGVVWIDLLFQISNQDILLRLMRFK